MKRNEIRKKIIFKKKKTEEIEHGLQNKNIKHNFIPLNYAKMFVSHRQKNKIGNKML